MRLSHLDGSSAALSHTLTTAVAFVIVKNNLAAERLLRVRHIANGTSRASLDHLTDLFLRRTFPFDDTLLSANWLPPLGAWCAERGLTPSAGGW
jgi:hypothetical protein